MRIGIIGCGRIGHVHGLSIKSIDAATVVAVSDPFEESAKRLAKVTDADIRASDELITSDDIDAVIIATPTTTHYDLIHTAAKAGKAIFCEKPIDMDADRIRECIAAVDNHNVPFMTGLNRRFDKNFSTIQQSIQNGDVGSVEILTILSRDPSPPPMDYVKTSGGLFRDMMIHDFDMARFLLGEELISVYAVGSVLVDPAIGEVGDVDTAAVTLKTATGKICQISNSRRATYGYDQRVEVHGSKGMLRAENVLEHGVELANGTGFTKAATEPFFLERYADAYVRELEHFIDCVSAGKQPHPSAEDGLKAQLIADAAAKSLETGQVVSLD